MTRVRLGVLYLFGEGTGRALQPVVGGVVRSLSAASARMFVGPVARMRRPGTDVPVDSFLLCLLCVICAVMRLYGWP